MQAIILSIGDELVLGQTVDTNSAWLSQQLAAVGCSAVRHITVGDDQKAIEEAIRTSASDCDFLIISGGIGPTEDDLTRQALAAATGLKLVTNDYWLARLVEFFESRGREMPEINKAQAMIPDGARMIENTTGTAAGIHMTIRAWVPTESPATVAVSLPQQGEKKAEGVHVGKEYMERMFGKQEGPRELVDRWFRGAMHRMSLPKSPTQVFVLPGVPKEMKAMFTLDVLPHIKAASSGAVILSRTLHTFGLGESAVAEKLGDLMRRDRNPSVGTTVSNGIVSLRINARFPNSEEASKQLEETTQACEQALGDLIFGLDEQMLQDVVAKLLFEHPLAKKWAPAVCTAESCTGGLLAKMFTDVAGSSAYFRQGWITYDNEAKVNQLNVKKETLDRFGAVSEQTVIEMARGAQTQSGAAYALAISGIAGPGGGTPEKPVGTVCIALATCDQSPLAALLLNDPPTHGYASYYAVRTFILSGDREMIRDRAAKMALTILRFHLIGKVLPF